MGRLGIVLVALLAGVAMGGGTGTPAPDAAKGVGPYFDFFEAFARPDPWRSPRSRGKLARYLECARLGGGLAFCPENIYWTRTLHPQPRPDPHRAAIEFARILGSADLDVYLGINLLADERDGSFYTPVPPHVPRPHDFGNPLLRAAYAQETLDIVNLAQASSGGRVAYVSLVLEADFYYYCPSTRPDYPNLIEALLEAHAGITAEHPALPVGVYFTLNALWDEYQRDPSVYAAIVGDPRLNGLAGTGPGLDFLGASSYPIGIPPLFSDPDEVVREYYALAVTATVKPFHVPELGWPSENVEVRGQIVESSPAEQAEFVRQYFERLIAGLPIAPTVWFVPHDFSMDGFPEVFCFFRDMGLWDRHLLHAKPAWGVWLNH
ncbi:MAG: hypothetical protein AB1726_16810 [Planctomycetota bacterium]